MLAKLMDSAKWALNDPYARIDSILKGKPIPEAMWSNEDTLWVEIPPHPNPKEIFASPGGPRIHNPSKGQLDRSNRNRFPDRFSWTLLQAVIFSGRIDEIPKHVDLTTRSHPTTKETALHWAVDWQDSLATEKLLIMGADIDRLNKWNESPKDLAETTDPMTRYLIARVIAEKYLERGKEITVVRPTTLKLRVAVEEQIKKIHQENLETEARNKMRSGPNLEI